MKNIFPIVDGNALTIAAASTFLFFSGCGKQTHYVHIGPDSLPAQSYEHKPEQPFDRSEYVTRLKQMTSFYDVPGEAGYFMQGGDYGYDSLSFILTETQPNGGPPLHTHETEESHIVLSGRVEYVIGDRRFTVEAPYVVRIPAGVPHTFRNAGSEPLNLIGVLPQKRVSYTELGRNPLVKPSK